MRIDGTTISANSTLDTDICIVGAGPAGLTLANELMDGHTRIHLLEAGGDTRPDSMDALTLDRSGTGLEPASDTRWRQIAGTAVIWNVRLRNKPAARYVPLKAIDFERRRVLPYSGWPFSRAALDPHYRRAEEFVVHRSTPRPGAQLQSLPLDPGVVTTTLESFGYASLFTHGLPKILGDRSDVTIVTHAMVASIEANAQGDRAEYVKVLAGGTRFIVRFHRALVLAAGGIENPRLLLMSRTSNPKGLGNSHDLVGRFFMDHPRVRLGEVMPADPAIFERTSAYDIRWIHDRFLGGKLTLAEPLLRSRELLNGSVQLLPHPSVRDADSLQSVKELIPKLRRGKLNRDTAAQLMSALAGTRYLLTTGLPLAVMQRRAVPVVSDGGWSSLRNNRRRFHSFELVLQAEQAPAPNNRVILGDTKDEFGLPRPRVVSNWSDIDIVSIRKTTRILALEFERAGIGRFIPDDEGGSPQLYQLGGAHHHMGTTRMHTDPKEGVTDENGRLHGLQNVFVAGSSLFPTGGYANPTLTLLALALRLADHLKARRA